MLIRGYWSINILDSFNYLIIILNMVICCLFKLPVGICSHILQSSYVCLQATSN